jgi:hypothetical protein
MAPVRLEIQHSDLTDIARTAEKDVLIALKAAVAGAGAHALQDMRAAIRARTVSTRLPNIIGAEVYPSGTRLARNPAAVIAPRGEKAEMIFRQIGEGATITVRRRRALAIPVHNVRDANGALLPPAAFPTLVYIPSKRRDGVRVGVLALPAGRIRNGALRARDRRAQAAVSRARTQPGVGEDFTVMFILVRAVRIQRAMDPEAIMQQAQARMPALFAQAINQVPDRTVSARR